MIAWEFLPAQALFPLPWADTRSPLSSVVLRFEDPSKIDATLGADFPVVQLHTGGAVWLGLGVAAQGDMGFAPGGSLTFAIETFDGTFAFPLDAAWGPLRARLQWAHTSAHLADGARDNPDLAGTRRTYSREWTELQVAGFVGPVTAYVGGRAILHAEDAVNPWGVQVGAQAEGPWRVAPFAAVDLQLYGEQAWGPRLAGEAGAVVHAGHSRFRLGLLARTGPDDTGQLTDETEEYLGLVLGFDRTGALTPPWPAPPTPPPPTQ